MDKQKKTGAYTESEKEIIRRHVAANPTNLSLAFKNAADETGRVATSISTHYYNKMRGKEAQHRPKSKDIPSAKPSVERQESRLVMNSVRMLIPKLSEPERLEVVRLAVES